MRWWAPRSRLAPQPEEDAARWALRLEQKELSCRESSDFEQWLRHDPAHQTALDKAARALEAAGRHAGAADILEMRKAALGAGRRVRGAPWALTASIVGIGIAVSALWVAIQRSPTPPGSAAVTAPPAIAHQTQRSTLFETAVGERSTISLPDGSSATLDTQSAIDVEYTAGERAIRLLRGQALFEVAKHKATPFQVYAAGRRITAIGTTFNVRVDGERLRVALIEGKLRVTTSKPDEEASAQLEQITMSPGESLDTSPNLPMAVRVADVTRTASWREGVAVFVDARLADVVAEMNRYTPAPIVIAAPAIGELHVSGVFKTGDPERFAASLADVFPISVDHNPAGGVVLRPGAGAR